MQAMPRERGVTLVELVIFIVLVSIAFAALTLAMSQFTRYSADPLIRKQALAIAESLLDEIQLMPFTICDPDDTNASTGSTTGCATVTEAIGPEGGESRGHATTPFDNVNDYNTYSMQAGAGAFPLGGIRDITGAQVAGLLNYAATVAVAAANLGSLTAASGVALKITVTVTAPDLSTVVLEGYRTRYAPDTAP